MHLIIRILVFSLFLTGVFAQRIPFLTEEQYDWLSNEISGDAAYEHIRFFTQFHRPRGGSEGLMEVARYVEQKARAYGLQDVRLIRQPSTTVPWSNSYGEIWLTEPDRRLLASTTQAQIHLADYSRTTHIDRAEIVHVKSGTNDDDYKDLDVAGKIVLGYGSGGQLMREAVWERGALGVISYPNPSVPDYPVNAVSYPDQIHWGSIPVDNGEGKTGTFGFSLTARQARELINQLRQGPVFAGVDIESSFGDERWQVMVEAFIRGTNFQDQDVVLTGHLQEEKFSANDDASGCASVLEIGRSLAKLIRQGRIERPRRNLRFWWVTEISSQRQYFADHPQAHEAMFVNINQDMVGADQSQELLRVQNMTRVPFARFHFLNDVAEAILEFVRDSNTANLSVLQAGSSGVYPRPILSRLGSRHRYNARAIPFHNNTDHMTFNEAPIGVPAITFTNWPDNFIHTSDDDLWNIDRTQLQRNAFTVASIAYVMASLDAGLLKAVLAEFSGRSLERIDEDFRLAMQWLSEDQSRYYDGVHQLEEALARELRAAASLRAVAENDPLRARIDEITGLLQEHHRSLNQALSAHHRGLYGAEPPAEVLSDDEKALQAIHPRLVAGPAEFSAGRGSVQNVAGLHGVMAHEVLSFVDGTRSGLEIFRAVAAEARRAGSYYYGEVTAEAVRQYLDNAETAGLIATR